MIGKEGMRRLEGCGNRELRRGRGGWRDMVRRVLGKVGGCKEVLRTV